MTSRDHRSAPATTWPALLQAARTPREVHGVIRDYLATWTPQELNSLPAECAPPLRFQEPEDVVVYAYALQRARLGGNEDEGLGRMWGFFMEASQRIAAVMDRGKATRAANTATADRSDD